MKERRELRRDLARNEFRPRYSALESLLEHSTQMLKCLTA
jgi:hypothetical protein